jgi:hypothetical protein
MLGDPSRRRMLLGLLLMAGLLAALVLTLGLVLAFRFFRAADYPGAVTVSDRTRSQLLPAAYVQRTTAYRTADGFPAVYNWYSRTFDLGPEARAQSACITMERATTVWRLERVTTVTVCDSVRGRLIFVQRFLLVRFAQP